MANPLEQLTLDQLRQRTSVKWRRFPDDVLPLWVAEMDVPLADPVRDELVRAAEAGDTGYDSGTEYPQAAAEFAVRRWGWEFDVANTATVPDVMQGIVEVLTLVTDPGDPVVINSPVYTPFYEFVEKAGRRPVESPLGEDHRIDLAGLEETFAGLRGDGGRAAYLLCSPHNPTGTVHTRAELESVVRLAGEHGVRVVADEIHAPLVYPGAEFVPVLTVPGAENAFSLVSASKAWNLAGIKSALAIAGPDAAEDLKRMPEVVGHGASHLGVLAHTAALRHGEPWLDELLVGLDENRRLLVDLLAEHLSAVRYQPPAGTYLAWLDCRALALDADPADVFLDRGRVALVPGPVFGTGGAGHVRLNLGTSPEILEQAVRRMASAV